jgi:hypothetical protein
MSALVPHSDALSTHAHATARGARVSRPAHTPLSRPRTPSWPIHPSLFIPAPTDMHSSARTGMQIPSSQASRIHPQSTHTRARLTQARWHSFNAERARVSWGGWMRTICTRGSLCLPTCRPPPPSSPSIAARLPPWRARTYTHRRLHAHGDLPPLPVRDATLECAPFTRTVLRVPGRQWGTGACGGVYGS